MTDGLHLFDGREEPGALAQADQLRAEAFQAIRQARAFQLTVSVGGQVRTYTWTGRVPNDEYGEFANVFVNAAKAGRTNFEALIELLAARGITLVPQEGSSLPWE